MLSPRAIARSDTPAFYWQFIWHPDTAPGAWRFVPVRRTLRAVPSVREVTATRPHSVRSFTQFHADRMPPTVSWERRRVREVVLLAQFIRDARGCGSEIAP